jgi:MerR HTH family regulatory protein
MEKSPDAFRTISEVADDLDLPQHVLRFWETRFSQIKPMKRGGGRRYYRPQDIDLIKGIRHRLYDQGRSCCGRTAISSSLRSAAAISPPSRRLHSASRASPRPHNHSHRACPTKRCWSASRR